jgi:hypothetical protein
MTQSSGDSGKAATVDLLRVLMIPPVASAELIRSAATIERTLQRIRAEALPDTAWEAGDRR